MPGKQRNAAKTSVIVALAARGMPTAQVARRVGQDVKTVRATLGTRESRDALARFQSALMRESVGVVCAWIREGSAKLKRVMNDPHVDATTQVRAAEALIRLGFEAAKGAAAIGTIGKTAEDSASTSAPRWTPVCRPPRGWR